MSIKAIVVEPGREPAVHSIENNLESLQGIVGGYIQAVYPYDDPVAIICNEEAKLEGLPLNRALRDEDGDVYDIVAGTFLIVGLTEDDFGSVPENLIDKYLTLFEAPEMFLHNGEKTIVLQL